MTKPSQAKKLNKCLFFNQVMLGLLLYILLYLLSLCLSLSLSIYVIIFIIIMPISHQDFPLAFGSIISTKPVTIVLLANPT